jgi:hypothetical protein
MKIQSVARSFAMIGILALMSVTAQAAEMATYTCTASDAAGIYTLSLSPGSATLLVDGVEHMASGDGVYTFDGAFQLGDHVFETPTLFVPMGQGQMMFHATLSDGEGSANCVELSCS